MILKVLFSTQVSEKTISWVLLFLRLALAGMLLVHGWDKLSHYAELKNSFLDPLGIGSQLSLTLAIFAEFVCSLGIIVGLFSRLSAFILVVNMFVITFIYHAGVAFSQPPFGRELAYLYLIGFIFLLATGPGKFSLDYWLGKRLTRNT